MIKNLFVFVLFLVISNVQAGIISYAGYSRDEASQIVVGGGYEWLKWDVTKGQSVNAALNAYAADGWSLANSNQLKSLYDSFQFGRSNWTIAQDTFDYSLVNWAADENTSFNYFLQLFGFTGNAGYCQTSTAVSCYESFDSVNFSYAFYERDKQSSLLNIAGVRDDGVERAQRYIGNWNWETYTRYASSTAFLDSLTTLPDYNYSYNIYGVALVRAIKTDPVQQVSAPSSFAIFSLGLLLLVGMFRTKLFKKD